MSRRAENEVRVALCAEDGLFRQSRGIMNDEIRQLQAKLVRFFAGRPSLRLAFLFGSTAFNRTSSESDVDIGVYLEDGREEELLWCELSRYLEVEVDLVRLDQAPASLVSAILKRGVSLVLRERGLYLYLLLD